MKNIYLNLLKLCIEYCRLFFRARRTSRYVVIEYWYKLLLSRLIFTLFYQFYILYNVLCRLFMPFTFRHT